MNPQEIIDSYFIQDGQNQPHGSIKRSVLLALEKDFGLCILLPGIWKGVRSTIQLSDIQYKALTQKLPTFIVVSLFCTSVDVLARVVNKRLPPRNHNRIYFTGCLQRWFGLTQIEAEEVWQLRNGVSHNYKLVTGQSAKEFGHGRIIRRREDGIWEFYLRAMLITFIKVKTDIYNHLSRETQQEKEITAAYLEQNGFFYTR